MSVVLCRGFLTRGIYTSAKFTYPEFDKTVWAGMPQEFLPADDAGYYFPAENEICQDFLPDFNYATVDIEANIDKIFNRYINGSNHLDGQIGRVIASLEQQGLLALALIVVAGDHGEEFMERGRWVHNSEFHNEQIDAPLVLFGRGVSAAVIDAPTSHVDLAPTVMSLLDVADTPHRFATLF